MLMEEGYGRIMGKKELWVKSIASKVGYKRRVGIAYRIGLIRLQKRGKSNHAR